MADLGSDAMRKSRLKDYRIALMHGASGLPPMTHAASVSLLLAAISCLVMVGDAVSSASRTPSVLLGSGRVGKNRWFAFSTRDQGTGGDRRPCLDVSLEPIHRPSPPNPLEISVGGSSCSGLRPTPELLSVVDELKRPKVTVLAMAFVPEVYSVTLYFNGHLEDRTVQLSLLSAYKATKARLAPFRYAALAFAGDSCVSRFVAHARDGGVLYDGGRMGCHAHAGPRA
jgi:hypothetical protein